MAFSYKILLLILFSAFGLVLPDLREGTRQMEKLDRGIVAVRTDPGEVFISWRLLGTDSKKTGFNLYRGKEKLNKKPVRLLDASQRGDGSINGTKATPVLSADLFGDWREEVIFRGKDNSSLLLFSTTIPTEYRIATLMHDPVYRLGIAWQNVVYNQPPHMGYYMGGNK
jgi:hypothetical protein